MYSIEIQIYIIRVKENISFINWTNEISFLKIFNFERQRVTFLSNQLLQRKTFIVVDMGDQFSKFEFHFLLVFSKIFLTFRPPGIFSTMHIINKQFWETRFKTPFYLRFLFSIFQFFCIFPFQTKLLLFFPHIIFRLEQCTVLENSLSI